MSVNKAVRSGYDAGRAAMLATNGTTMPRTLGCPYKAMKQFRAWHDAWKHGAQSVIRERLA